MRLWTIAAEAETPDGLTVLLVNSDLPIRVLVGIPDASDDEVRRAAEYVAATLNVGEN